MIGQIYSSSANLIVDNGYSHVTYHASGSNSLTGQLRYMPNSNHIEYFDGHNWMPYKTNSVAITLHSDAELAIKWAYKKFKEEREIESLVKEHPAIHNAYENLKRAEKQLQTTIILSKNEQTTS